MNLVKGIYHSSDLDSFYVSLVQFSGLKQSKQHYIPGKNGIDSRTGYYHWQKFYGPTDILDDETPKPFDTPRSSDILATESLGGCDYLYLCLQDLCLQSFFEDPKRIRKTKKVLIIIGNLIIFENIFNLFTR